MAFKVQFFFIGISIIVGFLHTASSSSCIFNSDCNNSEGDYCCGGECRYFSCSYTTTCVLSSDCPGAKYCCASGDCRSDLNNCPMPAASIAAIVVGTVILAIILTALVVSCLCCASCPLYHSRLRGTVIIARPPYQNFQAATITTTTSNYLPPSQTIAPPPYPGPAYQGNQPSCGPQFSNTNTQYPGPPPNNYP